MIRNFGVKHEVCVCVEQLNCQVLRLFARSPDVTTLEEVMEAVSAQCSSTHEGFV